MKERHISQRKEGKRQNKKKVVEEKEKEEEEKVGTRIRRGLKPSRRIKNIMALFYSGQNNYSKQI